MSGKPEAKYPIRRDTFESILNSKGLTLHKVHAMPEFNYSINSIYIALKTGYMSYGLAVALSKVLETPIPQFGHRIERVLPIRKVDQRHASDEWKTRERGDPELRERNIQIKKLHDSGVSYRKLGAQFGMTAERVRQIIVIEERNERNGYR